jgi:2,4-dienoyl-CoA reductase [(3E)-enoyl-CoA-producing], peroxisomal
MTERPPSVFRDGLLTGQVALITGGGTGIGFGISSLLSQLGAHVVMASRKPEHLTAAVERLVNAGGQASAVQVDVREPDLVRAMVEQVSKEQGRIDILVNNAAGNFYVPSASMSPNAWKAVVDIDLNGTFFCSQAVYPVMRAQKSGRIVNISMTLHYRGWPMMAHASSAKAGIDALTKTLAVEWARDGIRVNAIAPGPIPTEGVLRAFATPITQASAPAKDGSQSQAPSPAGTAGSGRTNPGASMSEADTQRALQLFAAQAERAIPLGRYGTPGDIANMVAFLASSAGDWITGAIMVVDGGEWLARGRGGVPGEQQS